MNKEITGSTPPPFDQSNYKSANGKLSQSDIHGIGINIDLFGSALPRGLSREQAAKYIGVGTTLFDEMVKDGRMPKPTKVNSRTIWDRHQIDMAFDNLLSESSVNSWAEWDE